jgi:hypothetical protein
VLDESQTLLGEDTDGNEREKRRQPNGKRRGHPSVHFQQMVVKHFSIM